jgi:hypothetical protein
VGAATLTGQVNEESAAAGRWILLIQQPSLCAGRDGVIGLAADVTSGRTALNPQ